MLITAALTEVAHLTLGFYDDRYTVQSVIYVGLSLFMVAIYSRVPQFLKEKIATPVASRASAA
ncbi:MAG: hypothetical protein U0165_02945 [Polyangiaceae bacterium]